MVSEFERHFLAAAREFLLALRSLVDAALEHGDREPEGAAKGDDPDPGLPELVQGLLRPEAYPHRPAQVELIQTQMSFVFLTGDYVFKVKKPVDLGYLDYTTLEKRRYFCEQEVLLNRRLCPQAYLGVVKIVQQGSEVLIEGEGEAVEYAVKMRQLPRERMMDVLLEQNQVSTEMVEQVARRLAAFHQEAATSPEINAFGGLNVIQANAEENFRQTEKYVGVSILLEKYQGIKAYSDEFIQKNVSLFQERIAQGKVRDCHGDLHAAHVCFSDGLCIYDCIEFNDRFRYSDVASEVAFLAMDLDHHQRPDLSRSFVEAYIKASQDEGIEKLLDFYKCYRAYVRGKVESFKLDDPHIPGEGKAQALRAAQSYFDLAYSYIVPRPILLITAGLMGTGKTALAEALARRRGLAVISADVTRKRLAGIDPGEHRFEEFGAGIYSEDFSRRTYEAMLGEAGGLLKAGNSVIIDASFRKRSEREKARELAQEAGAEFWVIECRLDKETLRRRLEERLREGSVSDGRWEIFERQKADFEEIAEVPQERHIVVDTSSPPQELAEHILSLIS